MPSVVFTTRPKQGEFTTPEIAEPNNRLLAALPAEEYTRFFPKLERIDLIYSEIIYEPDDLISHVYFPEDEIVSLLCRFF